MDYHIDDYAEVTFVTLEGHEHLFVAKDIHVTREPPEIHETLGGPSMVCVARARMSVHLSEHDMNFMFPRTRRTPKRETFRMS